MCIRDSLYGAELIRTNLSDDIVELGFSENSNYFFGATFNGHAISCPTPAHIYHQLNINQPVLSPELKHLFNLQ